MARGRPHPPELKAAVIADMLAGMSASEAARKHGVSTSRAQEWRHQTGQIVIIEQKKAVELGDLIAAAVTDALAALSAIARQAANEAWLSRQDADKLAVFYGVLADKTVLVLSSAEHNEPDGTE